MQSSVLIVFAVAALQAAAGFEFATVGNRKVLLFSLTAGSGKNAVEEFRDASSNQSMPTQPAIPALFRSALLSEFREAVLAANADRIVVEMRKNNQVVASATFDITDARGITTENWFTPDRLQSTSPFPLKKSDIQMSLIPKKGHYDRSFYIHDNGSGCNSTGGLMGIGDSSADPCPFVANGGASPVLFFAKSKGPFAGTVGYADTFLVYMMNEVHYKK